MLHSGARIGLIGCHCFKQLHQSEMSHILAKFLIKGGMIFHKHSSPSFPIFSLCHCCKSASVTGSSFFACCNDRLLPFNFKWCTRPTSRRRLPRYYLYIL